MAETQQNATTQEQAQKKQEDSVAASDLKRVEQSKTYVPLSAIPKANIERCSYLLPNDLQCWRGADYLITVKTVTPATDTDPEAKTTEATYQLCARHAVIEQSVTAGRMKPEEKTRIEGSQFQEAGTGPATQTPGKPQLQLAEDGPKIPVGTKAAVQTMENKEAVANAKAAAGVTSKPAAPSTAAAQTSSSKPQTPNPTTPAPGLKTDTAGDKK